MPSPFPGMDPYLEGSEWESVDTQLSVEMARDLAPRLRPKYFVRTEKMPEEAPQITVEIRDVAQRSLVTAIEVFSLTNKRGDGREEYLAKRRRILNSDAHLIEIDLLRKGERAPMADPLPTAPYFVIVSRAQRRPIADVWPITLREPLPVIPVPLLPPDADVPLDLQQIMTNMYDVFGYDLELNYSKPPQVPLEGEDAAWARQLLDRAS